MQFRGDRANRRVAAVVQWKGISSLASAGRLFSKHELMIAICDELFTHQHVGFQLSRKQTSTIGLLYFFSAMTQVTEETKLLRSSRAEQRAKTFLITGCSRWVRWFSCMIGFTYFLALFVYTHTCSPKFSLQWNWSSCIRALGVGESRQPVHFGG